MTISRSKIWTLPTDRHPTEHEEQVEFVRWFRRTYRVRIFAIPNGGGRSKSQAVRLVAEGVSAGVPDLFVPAWSLWIEMKRVAGSRTSGVQLEWHEYLRSIGHTVIVCKGSAEAMRMVSEF